MIPSGDLDLLKGVRVVEFGDTIASAAAGRFLRTFGASVTKVRLSPVLQERLRVADGPVSMGYLLTFLDDGKPVVNGDSEAEVRRLIENATIVLCDRDGVLPAVLKNGSADTFVRSVEGLNRRAWTTLSAFGLTGPYRDYRGTDITYLASGGSLAYVRSEADGSPLRYGGNQGALLAGEVAAMASLHAFDISRQENRPVHFDVSAQEASISTGTRIHTSEVFFEPPRTLIDPPASQGRARAGTGVIKCADGYVHIGGSAQRYWARLCESIGKPEWVKEIVEAGQWAARSDEVGAEIRRWASTRTRVEIQTLLQDNGIPAASIAGPLEILESPQMQARDFFEHEGSRRGWPRLPTQIETHEPPTGEPAKANSIAGLRLIDMTQVLGPPLGAGFIAGMGAEVIKIEDTEREDMQRQVGPRGDGGKGPNGSGWFAYTNFSKKSVLLNLETEEGQATMARILATADVILENTTPSRAHRIGLVAEGWWDAGPPRLFISSSGFGRTGPLGDYRAFGVQLEAYAGLMASTRDRSGAFPRYNIAWADLVTGVYLAGLIASYALSDRKTRLHADVSMAEVVAIHLAGQIIAAANTGANEEVEWTNHAFPYAPHGVYRCGEEGDEWLAIAVLTDAEWSSLKEALGNPAALAEPAFATAASRWEHRNELDAVLEDLLRSRDANALFHALQQRGVPACPAWDAAGLTADRQLVERNYFPEMTHAAWGTRRVAALPWREAGKGPMPMKPAPLLGEHTEELLATLSD